MARPKKSGDAFSLDDLAVVAGIGGRAVRQVAEARLLPRGGGIRALKRVAVIGAFVAAGVPLMAAAQIAEAAHTEFNRADGEVPSGLDNFWSKLPRDEIRALPEPNDYWVHGALRRYPDIYTPGQAMDSDAVYEIAEREFVFWRPFKSTGCGDDPFAPDRLSPPSGLSAVGWIEGWHRGSRPHFVPFHAAVRLYDDDHVPTAEARALYDKMMNAHHNAVGIIVVNLSLAIRNGLDQLADYRAEHETGSLR